MHFITRDRRPMVYKFTLLIAHFSARFSTPIFLVFKALLISTSVLADINSDVLVTTPELVQQEVKNQSLIKDR
jgi:hypothetical protein